MDELDYDKLSELTATKLADKLKCGEAGSVCPLGLTASNARAVQVTVKIMMFAGGAFAVALIGAFATGVGYVMWNGFKVAVRQVP